MFGRAKIKKLDNEIRKNLQIDDHLIYDLFQYQKKLLTGDEKGFIFDGFPKN